MTLLWDNSLSELHGPYFVILLTAFGIAGLIAGGAWIWLCDTTRDHDLPDASPSALDAYEIAWLRSGAVGVLRVTVADLLLRGMLEQHRPTKWLGLLARSMRLRHSSNTVDPSSLTSLQRAAWTWFGVPRLTRAAVHPARELITVIAPLCSSFAQRLEQRELLETAGHRAVRRAVGRTMSSGILGVGLYLLAEEMLTEHHGLFPLIAMMVAGIVSTAIVCRGTRLSDLGRRFLEQVHMEFDSHLASTLASGNRHPLSMLPDSSRLLGVALLDKPTSRDFLAEDFTADDLTEADFAEDKGNGVRRRGTIVVEDDRDSNDPASSNSPSVTALALTSDAVD